MMACGEGRRMRGSSGRPRKRWMEEMHGGNGDGPGGAERSGEEPECVEVVDHDIGHKLRRGRP